jgi:hypothetical protein
MIDYKRKKRVRAIAAVFFISIFLVGCGDKREVDYDIQGDPQTSSDMSEIPEKLSYEISSDKGGNFLVDADVIYDSEYTSAPVVTLERADFTEEQMKEIADKLFGEGNYEVCIPYIYMDRDELLEKQEEIETEIASYGADSEVPDDLISEYSYIESTLEEYTQGQVIENDGTVKWLTAKDEQTGEDSYSFCYVTGKLLSEETEDKNDATYSLIFQKDANSCFMTFKEGNSTGYVNQLEGSHVPVYEDSISISGTGNACGYTEDEAKELAETFFEQLGFTDYAVNAVYNAMINGDVSGEGVNGYLVYFGRRAKSMTTVYQSWITYGSLFSYTDDISYGYEGAWVYVSDAGVTECGVINPMSVKEINTENAALLSFSNMDEMAQEYMKNIADKVIDSKTTEKISEVEFGLGRVSDETGESFSLIPMWYYFSKNYSDLYVNRDALFAVNAIDGSIIDVNTGKESGSKLLYNGKIVEY